MVDYEDCILTVINKITIRGLDTISISPQSQNKFEYVGSDKIFNDVEEESSDSGEFIDSNDQQNLNPLFTYCSDKIVNRRSRSKGYCDYYMEYEEFTHIFVDEILETAIDFIKDINSEVEIVDSIRESTLLNLESWPTIDDFDEKLGEAKLKQYIDCTSEVEEDWLYSLELLAKQSNYCSDLYKYEATFGIPSKCYPIPQATASVYFTFEVSRVRPKNCPVEVTFQYEASSCVMIPGRHVITEEMLFRIIDAKLTFFKTVTY